MKRLLIGSFTFILLLGILAIALKTTLGINITYVTYTDEYGLGMYIYDVSGYIQGLQTSLNSLNGQAILNTPPETILNWSDVISSIRSIANILNSGINWIIFSLNAIIAIFKIAFYIIMIIMALLGINNDQIWLYHISSNIYNLQIPYIQQLNI